MNNSFLRFSVLVVTIILLIVTGANSSAQISLIDKISKSVVAEDTISNVEKISIDNVNKEIEITDFLILKSNISEITNNKQKKLIENVEATNKFILQQGTEFRESKPETNSQFSLISAKNSWTEYYLNLRNYQSDLQKVLREIQGKQSDYIKNKNKWEVSIPVLNKDLSEQIKNHIDSNLKKMNVIINDFDLMIRKLVNAENMVIQDIIFADGILNDIASIKEKRRAELFKKSVEDIFSMDYSKSFSGSFVERMKIFYERTVRSFDYFGSNIKRNIVFYLVVTLLIVFLFYFIRKKYIQSKHDDSNIEFIRINRIILQKPVLTLIAVIFYLWTIIIPYSPLILILILYLAILIVLFVVWSPVINPYIKKIEKAIIILLILSNLEILFWHFGNSARFFMILESLVGILLIYRFILPGYKVENFGNINKGLIIFIRIITLIIFIYYSVAFLSNIFGYFNLTSYSLKVGVYVGVISIMAHGFYRIFSSLILAGVSVINIYYPEIKKKYGNTFVIRSNRFLKVILGFLWFSGIMRISELYESFSSEIVALFTDPVKIGSLTFTLGNLTLFTAILYFTYVIAKFTKRIFEREILAKQKMKRGLAASISLTIRMLLVFVGTLLALSVSGMDLGKIGIIAGALSVGIGFGLQNVVNNFISGLILVYEKPVQEGDTVEVDTLLGRVSNIGIRSSTITTYGGAEVVVPNSNLISNQLINWTLSDSSKRVEIKVGTAYGSDPVQVLDLILMAAMSHEKVLKDPEPRPLFEGFGDSSLNFRLLFWVHFEDGLQTQSDVAIKIYKLFKEHNVEIPFPQLDLHVKDKSKDSQDGNNYENSK